MLDDRPLHHSRSPKLEHSPYSRESIVRSYNLGRCTEAPGRLWKVLEGCPLSYAQGSKSKVQSSRFDVYGSMFDLRPSMTCEICILAGGLSQRMGRDKSRLRIGRRTMLSHIRKTALSAGFPVDVIRRDSVPRCGPIGGIYTGLKRTRSDLVLFLACDMPFVSTELIRFLFQQGRTSERALFTRSEGGVGFPTLLSRSHLETVAAQFKKKQISLQSLAKRLQARVIRPPLSFRGQLRNINTPADWEEARIFLAVGLIAACKKRAVD